MDNDGTGYQLNRTGDNVADLLNQVERKTIYPDATQQVHGLLSTIDKTKLDSLNIEYGTTEYWNSRRGYIPKPGAIIIYSDYKTIEEHNVPVKVPGIKIGSGNGFVQDLVFVSEDLSKDLLDHIRNNDIHITRNERLFWNNKLNVNETVQGETLIFNRN